MIGHDEDRGDELRAIEFERIAGHKPFDADAGLVHRPAGGHRPGLTASVTQALRLGSAPARVTRSAGAGSTPRQRLEVRRAGDAR